MAQDQLVEKMPQGGKVEFLGGFGRQEPVGFLEALDVAGDVGRPDFLQRDRVFVAPDQEPVDSVPVGPGRVRAVDAGEELLICKMSVGSGRLDRGRQGVRVLNGRKGPFIIGNFDLDRSLHPDTALDR